MNDGPAVVKEEPTELVDTHTSYVEETNENHRRIANTEDMVRIIRFYKLGD